MTEIEKSIQVYDQIEFMGNVTFRTAVGIKEYFYYITYLHVPLNSSQLSSNSQTTNHETSSRYDIATTTTVWLVDLSILVANQHSTLLVHIRNMCKYTSRSIIIAGPLSGSRKVREDICAYILTIRDIGGFSTIIERSADGDEAVISAAVWKGSYPFWSRHKSITFL